MASGDELTYSPQRGENVANVFDVGETNGKITVAQAFGAREVGFYVTNADLKTLQSRSTASQDRIFSFLFWFCMLYSSSIPLSRTTTETTLDGGRIFMDDTYTLMTTAEIDASRQAIWDAWTDPAKIAKWWGPEGFLNTVKELDVREGGKFRVVMHAPDGTDYHTTYVFDHLHRPDQLIYTHEGSKEFGLEPFQSVVDLKDEGGMTKVTLKARFISAEEQDKHVKQFHADEGARQLLERLARQVDRSHR